MIEATYSADSLFENKNNWAAMLAALLLSLVLHLCIYAVVPNNFASTMKTVKRENLQIEIIPPEPDRPALPIYAEANPDANNLKPLAPTNQESFQDQSAAQENPDLKSTAEMPTVEGEIKDSAKIVSGDLDKDTRLGDISKIQETLDRPLKDFSQTGAQPQNAPDAGDAGGVPLTIEQTSPGDANVNISEAQNIEDMETSDPNAIEDMPVASMALPAPKARPSLTMRTPAGPLADSNTAASQYGAVAIQSKFSEFGAYQQRMFEAVCRQWYLLASRYDLGNATNTLVSVEFFVNPQGDLTSFKVQFNTSTHIGKSLCEQAIMATAPYGAWTKEMMDVFGNQDQSVKINFHYR